MTSRVNACEVKTDKLLKDFLFSDRHNLVWFSLGLSLSNHAIVLPHLVNVNLDEILIRIITDCQSCIKDFVDDFTNLYVMIVEVFIFFGKVDGCYFFSEEKGPEEIGSASRSIKCLNCSYSQSNRKRAPMNFLIDCLFSEDDTH